jgi:hypothetical protein
VAAQVAVGELGLTIDAFEAMTPREFQWRVDGAAKQDLRELKRTAQLACWVLSAFSKKPLTVSDLIQLPASERPQTNWTEWATAK